MKISSSFYNTDRENSYQSFKGIPPNPKFFPDSVGKMGKVVGEYVSMPEQKLLLATSALIFQPLIDLKFADEDKKTDAAIKSASKAIAGGITGVTIRAAFIKIAEHFIGFNKHNKLNLHFFPDDAVQMKENSPALADIRMNQYCKTLGTLFAILVMVFCTNSKIDAPLTSDFQDLISGVVKENKSWIKSLSDVGSARKDKIKSWFNKKKNILSKIRRKGKNVVDALKDDTSTNQKKEAPE